MPFHPLWQELLNASALFLQAANDQLVVSRKEVWHEASENSWIKSAYEPV